MKAARAVPCILVLAGAMSMSRAGAPEPAPADSTLAMSADLRALFQAEMRELLAGTQTIAASLPAANWESLAKTARAMRDSYVLEKKLTKAQEEELSRLPSEFRALDEGFHARANKLAHAAMARDAEAVSFHFSRMLDTCVACHATYAKAQFPQFATEAIEPHHH